MNPQEEKIENVVVKPAEKELEIQPEIQQSSPNNKKKRLSLGKFFLGSAQDHKNKSEKKPVDNVSGVQDVSPIKQSTSENKEPKEKEIEKDHLALKPTFSGFSQGSFHDDQQKVEEKEDVPSDVEDEASQEQGYFKEVF